MRFQYRTLFSIKKFIRARCHLCNMYFFGGALVGEEALVAAEAAAEAAAKEAAAKAADGADGADVIDDDAPSDEDGAPVAPEA